MNLSNIKLSFLKQNNTKGLEVIQKIERCAEQYKFSYNKAITFLLSSYTTPYEKRVLNICRSIYPYDGQPTLKQVSIAQEEQHQKIPYKEMNYLSSEIRQKHEEDKEDFNITIGIEREVSVQAVNNQKPMPIVEIIDTKNIETKQQNKKKKPRKKKLKELQE